MQATWAATPADARNYTTPCAAPGATPAARAALDKWNFFDTAQGKMVSGGCTCHVAQRIWDTYGLRIPWSGNANAWWPNSIPHWPNGQIPRKHSIAVFAQGNASHVAFVEEVSVDVRREAKAETRVVGHRSEIRTRRGPPFVEVVKVPITQRVEYVNITETYRVTASNRSAFDADRGVYRTYWTHVLSYRLESGRMLPVNAPLPTGDGRNLTGYLYAPR